MPWFYTYVIRRRTNLGDATGRSTLGATQLDLADTARCFRSSMSGWVVKSGDSSIVSGRCDGVPVGKACPEGATQRRRSRALASREESFAAATALLRSHLPEHFSIRTRNHIRTTDRHVPTLVARLAQGVAGYRRGLSRSVRRGYLQGKRALLRVIYPTGVSVTLLGPDGVGKSTLAERLETDALGVFRSVDRRHLVQASCRLRDD